MFKKSLAINDALIIKFISTSSIIKLLKIIGRLKLSSYNLNLHIYIEKSSHQF